MIYSYDKVEEEVLNYIKAMKKAKLWYFIYWLSNDLVDICCRISKVILIAVVYCKTGIAEASFGDILMGVNMVEIVSTRMDQFTRCI